MGRSYQGKDHYKGAEIGAAVADILENYSVEVKRATNNSIDTVAKEAKRKLQNTSPKRTGDYAKGWALKRYKPKSYSKGVIDVVVHNKDHYQLTHLLENGHVIRNAKGEYGRTRGIKHIEPVEEWAADELPREIERELDG